MQYEVHSKRWNTFTVVRFKYPVKSQIQDIASDALNTPLVSARFSKILG